MTKKVVDTKPKYLPYNVAPDPSKAPVRKLKMSSDQKQSGKDQIETEQKKDAVPLPGRKGVSNVVKLAGLETNYFVLAMIEIDELHLYALSFCPGYEPGSRRRECRVIQLMMDKYEAFHRAATDHKQLIVSKSFITETNTSTALDLDSHEVGDLVPGANNPAKQTCLVKIDFTESLSVKDLKRHLDDASDSSICPHKEETVAAINLRLGRFPSQADHIQESSKNRIFNTSRAAQKRSVLGGGLEAYFGFEKSARTSVAGLLLNVNALTSAFYTEFLFTC